MQAIGNEVKDENPEADVTNVSSPASLPAVSLLSPIAMETEGCIIKFEQEQRKKAKVSQRLLIIPEIELYDYVVKTTVIISPKKCCNPSASYFFFDRLTIRSPSLICARVSPKESLKRVPSGGRQTVAGDAGEAVGGSGELRVGAAEAL